MMIQIVEPKELIGRIVPERRPLAFPRSATSESCGERPIAIALIICLIIVVSFGALVAGFLELVLEGL